MFILHCSMFLFSLFSFYDWLLKYRYTGQFSGDMAIPLEPLSGYTFLYLYASSYILSIIRLDWFARQCHFNKQPVNNWCAKEWSVWKLVCRPKHKSYESPNDDPVNVRILIYLAVRLLFFCFFKQNSWKSWNKLNISAAFIHWKPIKFTQKKQ